MTLFQIHDAVRVRAEATTAAHPSWPCRKGCDDCCRALAAPPRVTRGEWTLITAALEKLPVAEAESSRRRIRDSSAASRPVTCPLLDTASGACLIYDARPVACRAYGFYAERESVLGCARIESISRELPDVVWGNHVTLEDDLGRLGPAVELYPWLDAP